MKTPARYFRLGDHFLLFQSPDKVLATLVSFLEAPFPEGK